MLPSSDLLFAFPVKSRLVSIPCGHIELLRLGKSACCQVCNPFFFWSLRLGARRIEKEKPLLQETRLSISQSRRRTLLE